LAVHVAGVLGLLAVSARTSTPGCCAGAPRWCWPRRRSRGCCSSCRRPGR